jgi:hypothetical protein
MRTLVTVCLAAGLLLVMGHAAVVKAETPTFAYQTYIPGYYLGHGNDMVVDATGNAYVIASYYQDEHHLDILVVKLDAEGTPVWTLPIVGDELEHDFAEDIALDADGNVWMTGWTSSESFPIVNGMDSTLTGFVDAFITELDPDDGTILYSTFLGGDYTERGYGIAFNDAGEIFVVGQTGSTDFPTTDDAYQDHPGAPLYVYSDCFITKLSPDGREILYSTYFGGYKEDAAENLGLDPDGNIIISGTTTSDDFPLVNSIQSDPDRMFISKLSADGSTLLFSTYLGGDDIDYLRAMAVDSEGFVYITGETRSIDFPATAGAFQENFVGEILGCEEFFPSTYVNCFDAYVTKLATDGSGVVYGTFLGGDINDNGTNIVVDDAGRAYTVGFTGSSDYLGTGNLYAAIFTTKLSSSGGELEYALTKQSPSAGSGHGIALDPAGGVYITGAVGVPYDIYVAKLDGVGFAGVDREPGETSGRLSLEVTASNPFTTSTSFAYSLPAGAIAPLRLTVHDARGRAVKTLVDRVQAPGTYSVAWDGTDQAGRRVASGVYFCRVEWNGQSDARRIVLLK